jgi:hypothetical protein
MWKYLWLNPIKQIKNEEINYGLKAKGWWKRMSKSILEIARE